MLISFSFKAFQGINVAEDSIGHLGAHHGILSHDLQDLHDLQDINPVNLANLVNHV